MGNLALARSCTNGLPVRVIRGSGGNSKYSPSIGYRYDGLFTVEAFWHQKGADGHEIWRFRLVSLAGSDSTSQAEERGDNILKGIRFNSVQRLVRSTAVVQAVKVAHDYTCQICRTQLRTFVGPYAEGAHIRPLGEPHSGPDVQSNVLCLCPDCHVQFDYGAFVVHDDLRVYNLIAEIPMEPLRTVRQHTIDRAQLAYHRGLFASRASVPVEYKPSSPRRLRVAEGSDSAQGTEI
jgi:putative restriction endonuclease